MVHPTTYWHGLPDGRVQCDLCPRHCRMRDGQRGLCFVRGNTDGRVVLLSWGRSSGFCVDPIEKKPLAHYLPGTPVLSFGTAGCNLTCRFCQNWNISKAREMDRLVEQATPAAIARAAEDLGCRSVAFTYNDPVVFHEYAVDTAIASRERGLKAVAVTAGYVEAGPRAEFYRHMDAVNVDLKAFSDAFYRRLSSARLGPVLDTLRYIRHETDVWLEITNLLIPGENDSDRELDALSGWVVTELGADVPIHFTAFHPDFRMRDHPRTPAATLRRARELALRNGVRYAYTGNVRDPGGASTRCHVCGALLVGRDDYAITAWRVLDSGCPDCGASLAGVFEERPGQWGTRRLPVRLTGG
jgi:pyruvate formate lyase activating enzyme